MKIDSKKKKKEKGKKKKENDQVTEMYPHQSLRTNREKPTSRSLESQGLVGEPDTLA